MQKNRLKEEVEDGYFGDTDSTNFQLFANEFSRTLVDAAKKRKSYNVGKKFRRLDSIARLLEGNSTCAAVYYDSITGYLWLTNNRIHHGSKENNQHFLHMKAIFNLISDENVPIGDIVKQLSVLITKNILQEYRYEVSAFGGSAATMLNMVRSYIEQLFQSGEQTKEWRKNTIESFAPAETAHKNFHMKVVNKVSRLFRDFVKIRTFLTTPTNDPTARGIVSAIRSKRTSIIHPGKKDVHAEMKILGEKLDKMSPDNYTGISKLCCDHCALAMNAFNSNSRGLHGQSGNWPIPDFIENNPIYLRRYIGNSAFSIYQTLSPQAKQAAKTFVASKESNPTNENARHGRAMNADSSDSDVEVGIGGGINTSQVEHETLASVCYIKNIQIEFESEFGRLIDLGLSPQEIANIFDEVGLVFIALSSEEVIDTIELLFDNDSRTRAQLFYILKNIYFEHPKLYQTIINDENGIAAKHPLDKIIEMYTLKIENPKKYEYLYKLNYYDYAQSNSESENEESDGEDDYYNQRANKPH